MASAYDQDHREMPDRDFEWMSSNETVGTVDRAGVFAAISAGETVVSAGAIGAAGVADMIVTDPEPASTPAPTSAPTSAPTETSPADETPASATTPSSATPPAPKATPESTGFGGLFVVIGVVVAYGVKRRKE